MVSQDQFYIGADYGFDPGYGIMTGYGDFSGFRVPVSQVGTATDARSANQLKAVSDKIFTGVQAVEVQALQQSTLDSMPKDLFKEINRLKKLTGVDITLHGPLVEPTGLTRQGWEDTQRQEVERQVYNAIARGHDLNPKGNTVVTFHSSNGLPEPVTTVIDEKTGKPVTTQMGFVDERTQTFQWVSSPITKDYLSEEDKRDVLRRVQEEDKDRWAQQLHHVNFNAHAGMDRFQSTLRRDKDVPEEYHHIMKAGHMEKLYEQFLEGKSDQIIKSAGPEHGQMILDHLSRIADADIHIREAYRSLKNLYNEAYEATERYGTKEDMATLDAYRKTVLPKIKELEQDPTKLEEFGSTIIDGVNTLRRINSPTRQVPIRNWAIDKASDTFGNAAFKAYKKFKDTAPIISIENPPVGMGLSTGEDLRDLVKASRKKFVQNAVDNLGMSESQAQEQAEKLIGVTWDVGHINMLRKYGYDEKDIIKETKKIAPLVKNVHLSDNFGLEHTELPMGMGNVPTKKHLELIDQYNKQAKKIMEYGTWVNPQGGMGIPTTPIRETLANLGSPLYGPEATMAPPYWSEINNTSAGYYSGLGATNTDINHQIFGGNFAALPVELGGQLAGRSRVSGGTPFE